MRLPQAETLAQTGRACVLVQTKYIKRHGAAADTNCLSVIPDVIANPDRGQLNRVLFFSLSPFAPENLVSRDGFGRPVPHQPAQSSHSG